MTRSLAYYLARKGVTVNALAPGTIATEGVREEEFAHADVPDYERHALRDIPAHRLGDVDEVAAICAFLCSPAARYINGADLIADVTAIAIRSALQQPDLSGVYHLVASGETTWHGYASHVVAQARHLKPDIGLKVSEIAPVPTSAFPTPAQRPLNSRLNTRKLQQAFGVVLPPWQQGVDRLLAEIL